MKRIDFIKRVARQAALKGKSRPRLVSDELQKISDAEFDKTAFLLSVDPSPMAKIVRDAK
jgi:hypothetical protein